jgi:hypothetical protein
MTVREVAAAASEHPVMTTGARLGFLASGLLHGLIAWVVLKLAWDLPGHERADERGALRTLAGSEAGSVLLWLVVAGFVAITLWQVAEALSRGSGKDRLRAVGRALVYGLLAASALSVVRNPLSASGTAPSPSLSGTLMQTLWGRLVIGTLGGVVVGMALYHLAKGLRARFLRDLREHPGPWIVRAGRIGYAAKGGALALVGGFLVLAAVRSEDQPVGLDETLRAVADLPLGAVLLTLAALGFAAYGVYSLGRARYCRV